MTEEYIQQEAARYLREKKILFTHPPNGGYRSKKTGAAMKRAGTARGVPDLLIFTLPPVAIEIKTERGRLSAAAAPIRRGLSPKNQAQKRRPSQV